MISRSAGEVYSMVADITKMGTWSPVCKSCWWDPGAGPSVGAWFTGRNELGANTWETRSQVVAADPGQEFAFVVNGQTRWGYQFHAVDGVTRLTESWELLPEGRASFEERYGMDAEAQIANRLETAKQGIAATLAAIKKDAQGD